MNIKQVITELCKYPENMDVFIAERKTEFTYGIVNSIRLEKINFIEAPNGNPLCKDNVIIIDEE